MVGNGDGERSSLYAGALRLPKRARVQYLQSGQSLSTKTSLSITAVTGTQVLEESQVYLAETDGKRRHCNIEQRTTLGSKSIGHKVDFPSLSLRSRIQLYK